MQTLQEYKLHYTLTDDVQVQNPSEALVYELIGEVANDGNSSMFREEITKLMVGLKPSAGKHGYDDDFEAIEVKPANYTGRSKLDGRGNFSDLTWKRHRKYLKDKVRMLVSGFANGKLLYIVEFPYSALKKRIVHQLVMKLPNGDAVGRYVRNASFNYTHWQDGAYTIRYVRPTLHNYAHVFNRKFYALLSEGTDAEL